MFLGQGFYLVLLGHVHHFGPDPWHQKQKQGQFRLYLHCFCLHNSWLYFSAWNNSRYSSFIYQSFSQLHSKTMVLAAIFFNIHLFLLTAQWLCRKPVKRVKCSGMISEEECCSCPIYSNSFTAETRINRDMVLFSQSWRKDN